MTQITNNKLNFFLKFKKAFLIVLTPCFTFLFFGPFEMIAMNQDSIPYTAFQVFGLLFCVMLLTTILLTILVSILPCKLYKFILPIIFSFTVCGYLQGNLLNGELGQLTGDSIPWEEYTTEIIINTCIWLLIFCIIFFLSRKLNTIVFTKSITYASLALIIMQLVAFFSILPTAFTSEGKNVSTYLSTNHMFEYSEKENIIVYVLDRFDYRIIEEILAEDPNFFDGLDGFTSYTNTISQYTMTYPGLNYMLTNAPGAYTMPKSNFLQHSWTYRERNVLQDLVDEDYKVNIYTDPINMFDTIPAELINNSVESNCMQLNYANIYENNFRLSLFRYVPTSLKRYFGIDTDRFNRGTFTLEKDNVYTIDETIYAGGLDKFELVDGKIFHFYHFQGPHAPYTLTAEGIRSETETTEVEQGKGSLNIVFKALNQLKELGIYKDATIIITADHVFDNYRPPADFSRIMMFYKESGKEDEALSYSHVPISQDNVPATLMKEGNIDYEYYGTPIDEVKRNSIVDRYYHQPFTKDDVFMVRTYKVLEEVTDINNWIEVERFEGVK